MRPASAFLLALAVLARPAIGAAAVAEPAPPRVALSEEENAIRVYDSAVQSVVQIDAKWTESPGAPIKGVDQFFGKTVTEGEHHTIGSGVLWDDAGHVVTMARVVTPGGTLTLTFADGSHRTARLVGSDPTLDLSVLQLDGPASGLHPILAGTSRSLRVGQRVYVIGNPYGLTDILAEGLLGGLSAQVARNGHASLVLNASVNPGNAGGPILDSSGRLIGLVQGAYGNGSNVGFSLGLPIDDVAAVVPKLIADGHVDHPRLGVSIEDDEAKLPPGLPKGLPILGADAGSAAQRAGLLARDGDAIDVITAIDNVEIRSYVDLRAQLDKHRTGDHCTLTVWRSGKARSVAITLDAAKR